MIRNKNDLKEFLEADKIALGRKKRRPAFNDLIWKYEILLRKCEYYQNVSSRNPIYKLLGGGYRYKRFKVGLLCGFSIPLNTCGKGLCLAHIGTIVISNYASIGENCRIHVDVNIVSNDILDIEAFKKWRPEFASAEFIFEDDGRYICGWAVEKMSKSMYNVVNPDDIVEKYGADTLRLYEMFLGPIEQSKPWDTNGIDGVHRFLKKLWNLFYQGDNLVVTDDKPTKEELKSLHKLIKKISWDIENFSYNTSISAFMICVNELTSLKSHNKQILENIVILLTPFAPHISEELWHELGNDFTVCDAQWPEWNEEHLKEDVVNYAISFNGKARYNLEIPVNTSREDIEKLVLNHESSQRWLDGKTPKKIIVVPNKIVNVVV